MVRNRTFWPRWISDLQKSGEYSKQAEKMDEIDGGKDEMAKTGSGKYAAEECGLEPGSADQFKEVQEFNRMYKELDDAYHEIALVLGVSDGELSVLYVICMLGDGCLQRDICREVFISKQTVNSAVRKLEKKELLYLEEKSGRDKKMFLTGNGKKFVDSRIHPIIEMENSVFMQMEPEERKELLRLSWIYMKYFREKEKKLMEDML